MFVALKNGVRVLAEDTEKTKDSDDEFKCPNCGGKCVFRKGLHNIPHFSHLDGDVDCILRSKNGGGGESIQHMRMKKIIKELIEKDNNLKVSEYEYPLSNRIADYYCELVNGAFRAKVAVECVYHHKDLRDFMNKVEEYSNNNIAILPVFHIESLLKQNKFKETFIPSEIMLETYEMSNHRLFFIDDKNEIIYGVRLKKKHGTRGYLKTRFIRYNKINNFHLEKSKKGPNFQTVYFNLKRNMNQPYIENKLEELKSSKENIEENICNLRKSLDNYYIKYNKIENIWFKKLIRWFKKDSYYTKFDGNDLTFTNVVIKWNDAEAHTRYGKYIQKNEDINKLHESLKVYLKEMRNIRKVIQEDMFLLDQVKYNLELANKKDESNLQYSLDNIEEKQNEAIFWSEAHAWGTDEWREYFGY